MCLVGLHCSVALQQPAFGWYRWLWYIFMPLRLTPHPYPHPWPLPHPPPSLPQGRTSIFVAHRLSTIKGCDHIVVLAAGRVAEQGTHAQLMARGGVYADMWAMQAAEAQQRSQAGGVGVTSDDGGVTSSGEEVEAAAAMTPLPSLSARTM